MKRKLLPSAILVAISLFSFLSCSDSDLDTLVKENTLEINAGCDTYTIANSEQSDWSITSAPEWITPVAKAGAASDNINLYVESNASKATRSGNVTISYANGKTRNVKVSQTDEQPVFNLQRSYAVGWSFDVRTYMDSRGLREQIFNTEKLKKIKSGNFQYAVDSSTVSSTMFFYGNSAQDLTKSMNAKLDIQGKFNSFNLNINGAFGKSAMNNSKRIFSWVRGRYIEKTIYINQPDFDNNVDTLFTADFRAAYNKVINSGGSDESIRELIDHYGTHVILTANLGGCLDYYYSSVVESISDTLDVAAAIDFGFQNKFGIKADGKYKDAFNTLSNETIIKFNVLGGDNVPITNAVASGAIKTDDTILGKWIGSITDDKLELLHFQLTPMSSLFPILISPKVTAYLDRLYYQDISVTRVPKK
jgi:hypothetical protein